jgi:hypothetical protein
MTKNPWLSNSVSKRGEYVGEEEFASTFEYEHEGLQKLAFLLTANAEMAGRCMRLAFCQCIASSSVFKGWALNWARLMIIRNAVILTMYPEGQVLASEDGDSNNAAIARISDPSIEEVLDLPAFERCAYVICVLECYSTKECALLLGRSPREVTQALDRVLNQEGQINENGQRCTTNRVELGHLSRAEVQREYSFLQS